MAADRFRGVCLDENIERQFGKITASWPQHKKAAIDYDITNNPAHTLVAEVEGKVVGFICCRLYRDRLTGHIANLAVAERFQGMGIGRTLVRAALEHFRESGMRHARIETLDQNAKAQKFYPSLGFKEIGRQIYYFMDL